MTHPIDQAYQAALQILKPSPRALAHGLELHAQSLVVDTYGFGPQAAVSPAGYQALCAAGASPLELQDYREDQSMTRWAFDPEQRQEAQRAWRASGVNCVFVNAGEESNHVDTLLHRLARRSYAAAVAPEVCRRAFQPDDIVRAGAEGAPCYYLSTNGVPLANRCESPEEELRFIRTFFQLGARMMHLTYNRANPMGDGCGEARDAGLTDFGRTVIAALNRAGVIVDVAHCGQRTSLEAARASDQPIVASHTMCRTLADHARGKTDEVIRAIADTGGYVGIVACASFLKCSYDLNALLDHVAYVVKHFGAEHVGIGTDVGYAPEGSDRALEPFHPPAAKARRPWRSLSPVNSSSALPAGWTLTQELSLRWTNFPLYTVGLVQRGLSDDDIRLILGGNALRVANALWNARVP